MSSSKTDQQQSDSNDLVEMYQSDDASYYEASTVTRMTTEQVFGISHERIHGSVKRENLMAMTMNTRYPVLKHR